MDMEGVAALSEARFTVPTEVLSVSESNEAWHG